MTFFIFFFRWILNLASVSILLFLVKGRTTFLSRVKLILVMIAIALTRTSLWTSRLKWKWKKAIQWTVTDTLLTLWRFWMWSKRTTRGLQEDYKWSIKNEVKLEDNETKEEGVNDENGGNNKREIKSEDKCDCNPNENAHLKTELNDCDCKDFEVKRENEPNNLNTSTQSELYSYFLLLRKFANRAAMLLTIFCQM